MKLIILLILICFLLFFYRYPNVKKIKSFDKVMSPAYGRVMKIIENKRNIYVAIFLSPFDIHYQFSPISGEIKKITYDNNGKFELAYNFNKSKDNEKFIYEIENKRGIFKLYQIAGFLVRRITSFREVNDKVDIGDNIGLIHFGSRVDLIIPIENKDNFVLKIKEGDYLRTTNIIGYYK